jgi:hypothetical protein
MNMLSLDARRGMDDVELNAIAPSFDDRPEMPEYGAHSVIWVSSQNEPNEMTTEKKSIDKNNKAYFIS